MASNSTSRAKKMKGFMCHCPASTAVCMSQEYRRAVVVPPHAAVPKHQTEVGNNSGRYIRLGAKDGPAVNPTAASAVKKDQQKVVQPQEASAAASLTISDNVFQVVVMRVSIHCNGCAGKLKKHISKMEGVTSYSIDLENKRVMVMGHVSPSGVLESVSKVKKAEFWPPY